MSSRLYNKLLDAEVSEEDLQAIVQLEQTLNDMDYYTNKWVEGILTESEWAEIKTQRANLRKAINDIEAKYATE